VKSADGGVEREMEYDLVLQVPGLADALEELLQLGIG
jgi:hypothetical protein